MLNNSLAPIKRAAFFFGFMGLAVTTMTIGADFQGSGDQSSATVAQAKTQRHEPTDARFASVNPTQKQVDTAKRAIATSQQAMLDARSQAVLR